MYFVYEILITTLIVTFLFFLWYFIGIGLERYFNYLMSPKRGTKQLNATNALKKIIREDGSELSLQQLAKKYPNAN